MRKFLLFLAFLPSVAVAQVSITASSVTDSFERPIAVARLCFTPVDATETPAGFNVGSMQVVPDEVCGTVSNGILQSGLTLAPLPSGIYYHVYLKSANSNAILRDFGMTPITGSSWTLDTYTPNLAVLPVTALAVGNVSALAAGTQPTATLTGGAQPLLNVGIPIGPAPNLAIGTVSQLSQGATPTAAFIGTNPNYSLNLGLPLGPTGPTGPSGTMTIGSITTGAPGSNATITNSGTSQNAILNLQLPAGAAGTVSASGASGNFSISGFNWAADSVSELPRVDVTYPAFGTGSCTYAADPTGVNDSTCAIQAAITFAEVSYRGTADAIPNVYIPAGTYKISNFISLPSCVHLMGDGPNSTFIDQTNPSANTITVVSANAHCPATAGYTLGSIERLALYSSGYSYTGTFIEVQNGAADYYIKDVVLYNGGGRGIQASSERQRYDDLLIANVRWPLILDNNEIKVTNTLILAPGTDASGKCWNINCPNGTQPNNTWTTKQTLVSASGNGSIATYVVQGGNNAGSTNGQSPFVVGNYFTIAGIPDATDLNGIYQIASVTNNSPVSGEYTVTAANTATDTGTVTAATYQPTMLPDHNESSVFMSGATIDFEGSSIKEAAFQDCIHTVGLYSGIIQGVYCEGYPTNNRPTLQSFIQVQGYNPTTPLTQAIGSTTATGTYTVGSTNWFWNYLNNPSDATSANAVTFYIFPQDFTWNSTASSAYVSGVLQDQYEIVKGVMSSDGFHITARNQSGSTVTAAWPVGSVVVADTMESTYGTLEVRNNHVSAMVPPGNNYWATDCNDAGSNICADSIIGRIPNGYDRPYSATASVPIGPGSPYVDWVDNEKWGTANCAETAELGQGCIKIDSAATVFDNALTQQSGVQTIAGGTVYGGLIKAVQAGDGTTASLFLNSPNFHTTSGLYINGTVYPGSADAVTSDSIPFYEYFDHYCSYDGPTSSETHSQMGFCMLGGPNASTPFLYDEWWDTINLVWHMGWTDYPSGADSKTQYQTSGINTQDSYAAKSGTASTSSNLWNTPGPIRSYFRYWNGSADVTEGCGWGWTATTNNGTSITGATYAFTCNVTTAPVTLSLPVNTLINNQTVATDQYEGAATLAAGTVTVTNTSTPSSKQKLTIWNCGGAGTVGVPELTTITSGTSFVITSSSSTDTSSVCWWIH